MSAATHDAEAVCLAFDAAIERAVVKICTSHPGFEKADLGVGMLAAVIDWMWSQRRKEVSRVTFIDEIITAIEIIVPGGLLELNLPPHAANEGRAS